MCHRRVRRNAICKAIECGNPVIGCITEGIPVFDMVA